MPAKDKNPRRIFKLFKKGAGVFWKVERGEKDNALLYSGLLSGFPVFPPYKGVENQKTAFDGFTGDGKHNDVNKAEPLDTLGFASFPEGSGKTGKQNDDFEETVKHYMSQGLNEQEARFLAREEV